VKETHHGLGVGEAEQAVESTLAELREGFGFIRANRSIAWSLTYLAIAASLVGVLVLLQAYVFPWMIPAVAVR